MSQQKLNESALATRSPEELQQLEKLDVLMKGSGGASTDNVRIAAGFMKWALDGNAHLISPATAPPNIPLGCEFAFSKVIVSNDPNKGDVYRTEGGKLAIHKSGLERIAKAAGVVWDTRQCGRTDDMKDPHFAAYRVVGHYQDLDGTVMPVFGEKQMDLREGSERAKSMKAGDLQQQRKFIAEHAETKAKLRAIRSLGIKSGYSDNDLSIPFVVVKLHFNGRTNEVDDPDRSLQKQYSLMIAQNMTGSKNLLGFGDTSELKDVTPPPALTRNAEETQTEQTQLEHQESPKQCVPGGCLGMAEGVQHIPACFGAMPEPKPWIIPKDRGPAHGMAINDERVTPQILEAMRLFYVTAIEDPALPDLTKQGLIEEGRFLEAEIKRRGLFEYAPKS